MSCDLDGESHRNGAVLPLCDLVMKGGITACSWLPTIAKTVAVLERAADKSPLGVYRFLTGTLATTQNWRDEIQFPYPGDSDRIAQITEIDDEGGLNLNMRDEHIETPSAEHASWPHKFRRDFTQIPPRRKRAAWEIIRDPCAHVPRRAGEHGPVDARAARGRRLARRDRTCAREQSVFVEGRRILRWTA